MFFLFIRNVFYNGLLSLCEITSHLGTRFFTSTSFISVGIDQRLKLWHIDEQKNELIMKHCHMVDIRDILAVDSCFSETNQRFIIVIAGAGIQTICFEPNSLKFDS